MGISYGPFRILRQVASSAVALVILAPAIAAAQTHVSTEAGLAAALQNPATTAIVFDASITLTTGDLPVVNTNIVIDGNGFTLSGNNQFRGLVVGFGVGGSVPPPVSVTIQNLTIQNTAAIGGAGGNGINAGGGGAGLGGALYISGTATVTVSNVNLVSNTAVGGGGGAIAGVAGSGTGGGGGLGGAGGSGGTAVNAGSGGGGGFGSGAAGGGADSAGSAGIITNNAGGGTADGGGGGLAGGGGAGGSGTGFASAAGGGVGGGSSLMLLAGDGGFGGGGGGAAVGTGIGGNGGFGGGGGAFGNGGYGGGAGGSTAAQTAGFGAGANNATGSGGGGAGLGGAIFMETNGQLLVSGPFSINGNAVSGGAGGAGASAGNGFGAGIFLEGNGVLTIAPPAGATAAIGDVISDEIAGGGLGRWSLVKDGAGTLVLSGANTYNGNTTIAGGTLSVSSDANMGAASSALAMSAGTTLAVTATNTFARDLLMTGEDTVSVSAGKTATWTGALMDDDFGPGTLHAAGGGTLELANTTNSYSGGTIVTGGSRVLVTADGSLGSPGITVSLGDAASSGTLAINSPAFTSARPLQLGAGGGIVETVGAATDATLSGGITGAGGLVKNGDGALTLSGANSYAGATTVNAGTLRAGAFGVFGSAPALAIGASGAVDLNGFSQSVNTLAGNGSIALNGATLALGGSNASSVFGGTIAGNGGLVKFGAGSLALTGANSFTGTTSVSEGTLSLASAASLGGGGTLMLGDATALSVGGGVFTNNLLIAGQPLLNISGGQSVTWAGQIADNDTPGAVHLSGGGALTLANAGNLYSGGTVVGGGSRLSVAADGALGDPSGGIVLGDATGGGTLAINASGTFASARPIAIGSATATIDTSGSTNATLSGAISGNGGLTKAGAGTLTLSGANSYLGPTIVAGGTLRTGRPNLFGSSSVVAINGGATFDLNGFNQSIGKLSGTGTLTLGGGALLGIGGNNTSSAFGGTIGGTGGLLKIGNGTLALMGANSFTGGISVQGGALIGSVDSLRGNILNNSLIVFDQGSNGSYTGSMSGAGMLVKSGIGSLTLSGVNSYSGGTLVNAGTLVGTTSSLQGEIVDNAAIVFDQSIDGSFLGNITGTGSVTKLGSGTLTMSGAHFFSGDTNIGQGTLTLDGVLGGNVNVGAQGTLRGAGVIGGNLTVGGSIFVPAPGSPQATFNFTHGLRVSPAASTAPDQSPSLIVNGDLTTTPGSTFGVTVAPGAAPPIIVNGRATIVGTHLNVSIDDPNPARHSTYVAVSAANGLTLSSSDASNLSTTIVPVLSANTDTLFVTLLNFAIPLAGTATVPNAVAAARGIDAVKLTANGDLGAVIREVTALDDSQLNGALTSLAGEIHASEQRLSIRDSQAITDVVRSELSDFEHESEDDPSYVARGRQPHVWYQVTGEHASFRSGALSGATANLGGGASGLDFRPTSRWSIGGGGSLSLGGMALTDISGSSQMTAPRAFGYTGYSFGPFHVHGGGSAARSSYSTSRQIVFAATATTADGQSAPLSNGVNRTADADQSGVTRDAWSEFQHTQKFNSWTLDSKLGLRAAHFSRQAFNETGANAVSLDGSADDLKSRESDVNIHLFRRSGAWRPNVLLDFRRQIGDAAPTADVQFAGRADSQFVVNGLPVPRDSFQGLFGMTMRTQSGLEFTLEYETQQATDESHNAVHFRMRFR